MAEDANGAAGAAPPRARAVSIALQGRDVPRRFVWSVLDRLLADPLVSIAGIGASGPGAALAAVLAYGLTVGGREGGRAASAAVQTHSALNGARQHYRPSKSPAAAVYSCDRAGPIVPFDLLHAAASLYELPLAEEHPLKLFLQEMVDFRRLLQPDATPLVVSASNVRTGAPRTFVGKEIGLSAVLAAMSLPFVHAAVEIDGEHYWYGGDEGWPEIQAVLRRSAGGRLVVLRDFARGSGGIRAPLLPSGEGGRGAAG